MTSAFFHIWVWRNQRSLFHVPTWSSWKVHNSQAVFKKKCAGSSASLNLLCEEHYDLGDCSILGSVWVSYFNPADSDQELRKADLGGYDVDYWKQVCLVLVNFSAILTSEERFRAPRLFPKVSVTLNARHRWNHIKHTAAIRLLLRWITARRCFLSKLYLQFPKFLTANSQNVVNS